MDIARLPEPLLEALAGFIAAHLGLHYPPERWDELQRHLLALARRCGWQHPERQLRAMLSAPPHRAQVEQLARQLCIGETYFFRDPALFAALETEVLPGLAEARRCEGRRLRLWSAGCCSGEEAYSLAIAVTRALPDWRDWHITLRATDIHAGFLDKARAGIYGAWSFRGVDHATRERYFEPAGAGRWRIRPELARMVSFDHLNLAGDDYPGLETDSNAMDLVLCRNVLMYFAPDVARAAVQRLRSAIRDDGWLALSPSEADSALLAGFRACHLGDTILHRKCAVPPRLPSRPVVPAQAPLGEPPPDPWQAAQACYAHGDYAQAVLQLEQAGGAARTLALKARALANLGRLDEALRTCHDALLRDKCDPALHYLLAMIEQEQGAAAAAEAALKRALFLDQDFVLAHFALANQYRRRGKRREAARHYANVRRLLDACPPAADLPESDGLSAARLLALVQQQELSHGR